MRERSELILAKGVKDWYGKQAILRNQVRETLKNIFERYGYNPLETPIIEREEVLGFKGGGEIQKEVFRLKDQGKRPLALRFDQTVPLARFFANTADLKTPFKRYVIGEVFRDGPTQPEQGRYRIFTQCDIDVIGVAGMAAEAELLMLASDAFNALGLGEVTVKINNRKVLDGIMEKAGIPDLFKMQAILAIDKLEKIGLEEVKKELREIGDHTLSDLAIETLINHTVIQGNNDEKLSYLRRIMNTAVGNTGLDEISELLGYCQEMNFDFVEFEPSLARGLDYYTGTTFEVFLRRREVVSSAIVAGGRFDNMIGDFKGSEQPIPAVGISFGLERICMILESTLAKVRETVVDFYIVPLNTLAKSLKIAHILRQQNIKVDIDLTGRSLKSVMRYVDSLGIPFVGIIGENEVEKGVITVKRLSDGMQNEVPVLNIGDYLNQNI
jgi:histidyl-tRNA synthetase